MYSGTTTLLSTISPVSFTGLISFSGIFGGYTPYRVCAGKYDPGKCTGNHVFYAEPGLHRMVSQSGLWFHNYIFYGFWSQMDSGTKCFWLHFYSGGRTVCRLSFQTECKAADSDTILWRKTGSVSKLDDQIVTTYKVAGKPVNWCATRQVDKLNNENFFFPGTVYVPGCLCNVF